MATGVQLLLRDFNMDAKSRPCFSEEDVLNIFPVTKHINPRASDAYTFYTTGQTKIQQGYLKEGHELITEALNLLNSVYGAMHPGGRGGRGDDGRIGSVMGASFMGGGGYSRPLFLFLFLFLSGLWGGM